MLVRKLTAVFLSGSAAARQFSPKLTRGPYVSPRLFAFPLRRAACNDCRGFLPHRRFSSAYGGRGEGSGGRDASAPCRERSGGCWLARKAWRGGRERVRDSPRAGAIPPGDHWG